MNWGKLLTLFIPDLVKWVLKRADKALDKKDDKKKDEQKKDK